MKVIWPLIVSPLNVAMPELLVVADPLLTEPAVFVVKAVTVTPAVGTGLFAASNNCTDGCVASGTPLCALTDGSVAKLMCVAGPGVAVSVNVTGLPFRPVAVAVIV